MLFACHGFHVPFYVACWCVLQQDYPFEEVASKGAAGAKLRRLLGLRPLSNLLASTGVNSSRGLLLITLVSGLLTASLSEWVRVVSKLSKCCIKHGSSHEAA
jgi:hypothetical protein